jgi:hypothetical protein
VSSVWVRLRADFRQRWRAWLGLSLLIMVFFAPPLTAFAGARRTQSAYPRFLERQAAWDVLIFDASVFAPILWKPDPAAIERLSYADIVLPVTFADALGLNAVVDRDGHYGRVINRAKLIEGRLPAVDAPDEVAVTVFQATSVQDPTLLANQKALSRATPGSSVTLRNPEGRDLTVKVVGRIVSPYDFPPNHFDAISIVSPRLMDRLKEMSSQGVFTIDAVVAKFDHPSDAARFDREVSTITGGKAINPERMRVNATGVRYSARLQSLALGLLAGVAGITALLLLVQTLVRQSSLDSAEHPTLHALGMSRSGLVALSLLRTFIIAVMGAVLAGLAAWLFSPVFPFGVFRLAEPSPGLMFDAVPMALAPMLIVVAALTAGVIPAWRSIKVWRSSASVRPSLLASTLATAGMRAPGVAGIRLALERGRGRTAVPVRSTIAIVSMGVAAMVVALALSSSIDALVNTPALYGRTWDKVVNFEDDAEEGVRALDKVVAAITKDPDIEAMAIVDIGAPTLVNGRRVGSMLLQNVKGSLYPPVLEGRAPEAPDEIMLGSKTLRALHKRIDLRRPDTVTISIEAFPGSLEGMKIVGRTAFPPIDANARFGEGLLVRGDAPFQTLVGDAEDVDPPSDALVRFAPGVDQQAVIARLAKDFPGLQLGDDFAKRPSDVVDFGRVQGTPLILAGVLALIGAASLTHALVTSIRRRSRDLAILKTLGFVRRQVRLAVAWQSSALTLIALVIGVPVGVAAGRQLWNIIAGTLGVVPSPRVPTLTVALLVPGAVLLANVIAALPARAAARTQPALVLRSE